MRVLVCGGRHYTNWPLIASELNFIHKHGPITLLIHGAAAGVDTLAGEWAKLVGIPLAEYPAKWDLHGKAAGPIRNKFMLEHSNPDMVVVFPGGYGTANMMRLAYESNYYVRRVIEP